MEKQLALRRSHPLVPVAAASVLVMSLVGIGVFTGLIPSAYSSKAEPVPLAAVQDGPAAPQPQARPAHAASTGAARTSKAGDKSAEKTSTAATECIACGRVESVATVTTPGKASGVGAVAGGVGGALVGHQFGNGNGKTAMTVLGAAGGAVAGHLVEKQVRKETTYRINVRMDDGSARSFPASAPGDFAVGQRVRVDNGSLAHAS